MKLNYLFLNASVTKSQDQKNYETEVKKALCKDKKCIAHFLFDKNITIQKVIEMVKKKNMNQIIFKGVDSNKIGEIEKALIKRFEKRSFTRKENDSMSVTLEITSIESRIEKEKLVA